MEATKKLQDTMAVDLGALLDAGNGAVVTLVAGDTRLAAHKAVLTARSPVFEAMFAHDTQEAISGEVTISDVEGPVLRQLLVYLCTLQAPQLPNMATQLLEAADKYGVSGLKAACEQEVAAQLSVETAATTAVLAVRHSCHSLTGAAVAFIKDHNFQVMATQGWADAVLNQPKDVVEVSRLLGEPPSEIRRLSDEEKGQRLIQAAKQGPLAELQSLLVVGANVGATDNGRLTALHWAAREGHLEAARQLVRHGADVNARTGGQWTPLHYAARYGNTHVVGLLLASSADPSVKKEDRWTPLHLSATNGHVEAVTALLDAGADRGATNNDGKTPLDLARKNNRQKVVNLLTRSYESKD